MYGVDTFASDDELGLRAGGSRGARSTEHVCGMTSASNGGYMLTAGTDSKIRCASRIVLARETDSNTRAVARRPS